MSGCLTARFLEHLSRTKTAFKWNHFKKKTDTCHAVGTYDATKRDETM